MQSFLIIYFISALAIILGFIALLTQKIYIDARTQKPSEIKIPIVGRIRTNYPALVFVFLGFALSVIAVNKTPQKIEVYKTPPKENWIITGSIKNRDEEKFDYRTGTLVVWPTDFEIELKPDGVFNIKAKIEEGKTFEDVVRLIDYSHTSGSIQILPKDEYEQYVNEEETLIKSAKKTDRKYKPFLFVPKWYDGE